MIEFFVEGTPKPQPRPRAFSRGGHARVYDPGTAEGWKGLIALAAKSHIPEQPLEGPLTVKLVFWMPRPKRLCTKKKRHLVLGHDKKPDLDNICKSVLDALTQLQVWKDDSQVWYLNARKWYAPVDEGPGLRVQVRSLVQDWQKSMPQSQPQSNPLPATP